MYRKGGVVPRPCHVHVMQYCLFLTMLLAAASANLLAETKSTLNKTPIKVAWLGPMQKYGAYNAPLMAQDNINETGGHNNQPNNDKGWELFFQAFASSSQPCKLSRNLCVR